MQSVSRVKLTTVKTVGANLLQRIADGCGLGAGPGAGGDVVFCAGNRRQPECRRAPGRR